MRPSIKSFAVLLCSAMLCLSFGLTSCRRNPSQGSGNDFHSAKDNALIYSYEGIEITKKQILEEVEKIKPDSFVKDTQTMKPEEVRNLLNEFIIQSYKTYKAQLLFEVYAKSKNFTVSDQEVDETVERYKKVIEQNWSMADLSFEEVLERNNISYDTFVSDMRKQALQEKIMKPMFDELEFTEEELNDFFETHSKNYNQEQGAHLHIINFNSRAMADKALNEILSGADFHEIARQNMPPEQIQEGKAPPGDMGPIPVSNMPPQLVNEILSPNRPEMTPFVVSLSDEGYEMHFVIRVKGFIPEKIYTLEEPPVREQVINDLMEEKKYQRTETFIKDLEKLFEIKEHIAPPPSAYSQMMQQMPPMP